MTPEEQNAYFCATYDIIANYDFVDSSKKMYIGSKVDRVCRYCGKKETEVTFKQVAHALPELIGNRSLIAYDECDVCNELFSRVVEDHLGKYLGVLRTISQLHGKKGVPTYKSPDGKSRISMKETGLEVNTYQDDPIVDLDLDKKQLLIKAYRQPYVPMGVFKCFVKMAIAIAPEVELSRLSHLATWIRMETHSSESFPYRPLCVLQQFTPGLMPYGGITVLLLKRKSNCLEAAYMQFIAAFGNTLFQVVLPMPKQDRHILGKRISWVYFPVPFESRLDYGNTVRKCLDLSSPEVIKNDEHWIEMKFERAEEIS